VRHSRQTKRSQALLTVREIAVFAMLGSLMMVSDIIMNILPNIHLVGVMIVTFTAVYRRKALYPIYIYVFLIGLFEGFGLWWLPYLYIWTVLWALAMLIPRRTPRWLAPILYALVCGLHGFAFGFLWIPSQMLLLHFSFEQALIWWMTGFVTADIPHGIGNLIGSVLILPLVALIRKLDRGLKKP
jgi:energy-coupling factor transport system substrate-specific component